MLDRISTFIDADVALRQRLERLDPGLVHHEVFDHIVLKLRSGEILHMQPL